MFELDKWIFFTYLLLRRDLDVEDCADERKDNYDKLKTSVPNTSAKIANSCNFTSDTVKQSIIEWVGEPFMSRPGISFDDRDSISNLLLTLVKVKEKNVQECRCRCRRCSQFKRGDRDGSTVIWKNSADIKVAARAWANPATRAAAEITYGHICDWETSEVTSKEKLFSDSSIPGDNSLDTQVRL